MSFIDNVLVTVILMRRSYRVLAMASMAGWDCRIISQKKTQKHVCFWAKVNREIKFQGRKKQNRTSFDIAYRVNIPAKHQMIIAFFEIITGLNLAWRWHRGFGLNP